MEKMGITEQIQTPALNYIAERDGSRDKNCLERLKGRGADVVNHT